MNKLDTNVTAPHGATPINPLKVVLFLYEEKHLRLERKRRWILAPYLCAINDDPHLWTKLAKLLRRGGIHVLSAHQY